MYIKCKHYPDCDCYIKWESEAKEINPPNAELFVMVMRETENKLRAKESLEYRLIKEILNEKLEVLPENLNTLYITKSLDMIEIDLLWMFSEKSDFLKLKKSLPFSLSDRSSKKYPAKYYAFYHWLKIEIGIEIQFAKNDNDKYIKREIEEYAKSKYPNCSPQGFYRSFINLDITNRPALAKSFGKGYKEILIKISNNDNKLITLLKEYPN